MTDKETIKQLKMFSCVKPNKHWVSLTKKELFENEASESSWVFLPMGRPALVLSSLALVAVFAMGLFVLILPQKMPVAEYQKFQAMVESFSQQNKANTEAVMALEKIQDQLTGIETSLVNLKDNQNKGQALTMAEIVKGTAKTSEQTVNSIRDNNGSLSGQVLASLSEVENASKLIEKKATALQKEMFEAYLTDLKTRGLQGDNLINLNMAEKYYEEGKFSEAVIFITKIQ
ncbi:hypothetical protein COX24_02665 [bacterium (Candidatus Gribaldobacteria) CG23_combo_of_CG06-09_8_20_14_all_37_87_8]|nr:MAG: hypothetical protein COX24_02665 [bacterium (Candidatus Gribaldobacteria) CG23_combo_of_CG06-09_8_20_14_all_37_87_8]